MRTRGRREGEILHRGQGEGELRGVKGRNFVQRRGKSPMEGGNLLRGQEHESKPTTCTCIYIHVHVYMYYFLDTVSLMNVLDHLA